MNKSDFDEFVKRQQADQPNEQVFDPQRQLDEWFGYLEQLYRQISEYLEAYTRNGTAHIQYVNIQLNEEFSGPYLVRQMLLKIGRSMITFTPVGTMLIGSKGRVDVQGPRGSARLGLVNKKTTSARQMIQVRVVLPGKGQAPPPAQPHEPIEWVWKIVAPPPAMQFIELTQESFFDMVLSIADA